MPRLTYRPSCSSCATRAASWVRVSATLSSSVPLARGHALDAFAGRPDRNDPLHVNPGQVDLLGIDLARLDELLDLGDGDLSGHRAERVELPRRLVEDEVAVPVADARAHQGEIADDPLFERVLAAVEDADVLLGRGDRDRTVAVVAPRQPAVRHQRADPGWRVEPGDAAAAGAEPLRQCPLRHELD